MNTGTGTPPSPSLPTTGDRPEPRPEQGLGGRNVAGLLLIAVLTALCYPLLSIGLGQAPPFQFAALRAGLAGIALLAAALALRRPFPATAGLWLMVALSGLFTTTVGFLSMFGAAGMIAPGLATVLAGTQPIIAALVALAVFGEPFGTRQAAGMVLSLGGIALIAWREFGTGGSALVTGGALVILATLGIAVGNALTKRFAASVDPLTGAALQLLFGTVPLAALAVLTEPLSPALLAPRFLAVLLTLSLGGTAVAFALWIRILAASPLNRANAFTALVPVLGVAISVAFLGERVGIPQGLGMALAVAGIGLAAGRGR